MTPRSSPPDPYKLLVVTTSGVTMEHSPYDLTREAQEDACPHYPSSTLVEKYGNLEESQVPGRQVEFSNGREIR